MPSLLSRSAVAVVHLAVLPEFWWRVQRKVLKGMLEQFMLKIMVCLLQKVNMRLQLLRNLLVAVVA